MIIILMMLTTALKASNCYTEVYKFELKGDIPNVSNHADEMSIDLPVSSKFLSAPMTRTLAKPLTALKGSWGVRYIWKLDKNTIFFIKKNVKKNHLMLTFTPSECAVERKKVVVIDPGHGGRDPGAQSKQKNYEKNITLLYAKALRNYLRKKTDYEVYLTRSDDSFVSLRERIQIAESHQADIFLSIHADAFTSDKIQGSSIYTLSLDGASSESAKYLSELNEVTSQSLKESLRHQKDLLGLLYDIRQRQTIVKSMHAAHALRESLLSHHLAIHGKKVDQAGFVVLSSASVPSVLVELGYLSSPTDVLRLRSKVGRTQLVEAISEAVIQYLSPSSSISTKELTK